MADKWVDNLLEEFFTQSDKEKLEGLPTAPFMDREKVTKPSAQGKSSLGHLASGHLFIKLRV